MNNNLKLPLDDIEVMDDELLFVLGGAADPASITGAGTGCGCRCSTGSGCGCSCSTGAGCGCGCEKGSGCGCDDGQGCGCGCKTPAPTPGTGS